MDTKRIHLDQSKEKMRTGMEVKKKRKRRMKRMKRMNLG